MEDKDLDAVNEEQLIDEPQEQEEQSQGAPEEPTDAENLDNEEAPEQEEGLSPRQQKRVEQIEEKAKEYKFNKILDRIEQSRGARREPTRQELLDYKDSLDAPDEVYDRLERDRQAASQQGYDRGLEQAQMIEWKTNIRLDAPLVKNIWAN